MPQKESRCWTGFEPVPGKAPYSKGSCKKKAGSKKAASAKSKKPATK